MYSSKYPFVAPEITHVVSMIVFLLFSAAGIWIGGHVGRQITSDGRASAGNRNLIENLSGVEQTNILVIITHDKNSVLTQLLSAWMVIYLPETTGTIFLPIFPEVNKNSVHVEENLDDYFSIGKEGVPEKSFFDTLHRYYQWDHYVVLDKETLTDLIDILEGVFINGRTQSGDQTLKTLELISHDPSLLLLNQTAAITSVCQKVITSDRIQLKRLVKVVLNKSVMDDDLSIKMSGWIDRINGHYSLKCEFPAIMDLLH